MVHTGQIKAVQVKDNIFNFEKTFRYVENFFKSVDISIVNLETVLAGKPYTGYPTFSSPDIIAFVIKNIGFDIVVIANNHCLDRG